MRWKKEFVIKRVEQRQQEDLDLERRKDEVEKARQEHEAFLLKQEREKYGLTKQYKPLSQMVI